VTLALFDLFQRARAFTVLASAAFVRRRDAVVSWCLLRSARAASTSPVKHVAARIRFVGRHQPTFDRRTPPGPATPAANTLFRGAHQPAASLDRGMVGRCPDRAAHISATTACRRQQPAELPRPAQLRGSAAASTSDDAEQPHTPSFYVFC